MSVVKNVNTKVEYTTDTPEEYGGSAPTWTEVPVLKILGETDERASEAQTVETLNGLQGQAGELLDAAYIVAVDDDDSFLDEIKTAADGWTPTWFRETPQGQSARVIGGEQGGLVTWGRTRGNFGSVETVAVGLTASGANADDVFDIEAGGS